MSGTFDPNRPHKPLLYGKQPFALETAGYVSVQDMRDEGITTGMCADVLLQKRILSARRYIDRVTQRWFNARAMSIIMDGSASMVLTMDPPIIRVDRVFVSDQSCDDPQDWGEPLDRGGYRVYNRHMRGETDPDDRDSPKIQLLVDTRQPMTVGYPTLTGSTFLGNLRVFSAGTQNIRVDGYFGYTDPDGTEYGTTPDEILWVNKLLVAREFPKLGSFDTREDRTKRQRITTEWTREQGFTLEKAPFKSDLTGDPEIDRVLVRFMRPPKVSAI